MADFEVPAFIANSDVNSIFERMKDNLAEDIDMSEGSHAWNLIYPDAYEHAYFIQYCLLRAIKLIWPEFSYGTYLDYHGAVRNMARNKASYAEGFIQITGYAGTVIPEGSFFSTEQVGDTEALVFETTAHAVIGDDNEPLTIPIVSMTVGKIGNVPANTIIINYDKIAGIASVTNPENLSGGYDLEADEAYAQRQKEYDQLQGISYIGNIYDYRRWSKEVSGVGEVVVLPPDENPSVDNDSGIITIIVTDQNGLPAGEPLCAAIYNHIMRPRPESSSGHAEEGQITTEERLAPPGVTLVVMASNAKNLKIKAVVELNGVMDIGEVTSRYAKSLQEYILEAVSVSEIRYSKLTAKLSAVEGVADFKDFMFALTDTEDVSYGIKNIQMDAATIPFVSVDDIILTEGVVDQ